MKKKCLFRTASLNLYFVYFSILDARIGLLSMRCGAPSKQIKYVYVCMYIRVLREMELTKRRNEKSLASHPAGTRTRPSEIKQKHMERELSIQRSKRSGTLHTNLGP
jgi:hypothetical protein